MARLLFYFSFICSSMLWSKANSDQRYSLETRYAEVPVTHFEWLSQMKTFKLRYLVNAKNFERTGPIFVYVGGKGDISVYAQNSGFIFDISKTFNAMIVFIEHRYYGQSLPFTNESFSLDNLKYLTTREVLADVMLVVNLLKKSTYDNAFATETPPIVAFGSGYSGALAAWLRMKFPYMFLGAVASSAPMAFGSSVQNCECFYDVVTKSYEKFGSEQCVKTIKLGWDVVINLARSKLGLDFISSTWKLCRRLSSTDDVERLLEWLSNIYIRLSLSNYHYPTEYFRSLPAFPLKVFCDKLTTSFFNDTRGLIEFFGQALQVYTNYSGKAACNEFEELSDYVFNYQQCTELVMPKCSIDSDMFINKPWNYKNFSMECKNRFGISNPNEDWITLFYGGRNLKYYSNIVFGRGDMDAYGCYGINGNVSSTIWTLDVADGPHHAEMRNWDVSDNNYIILARKTYVQAIKNWLNMFP
ncbi:unnamed protein product [Phyllotreta striolata]|uniref:Lysosomal Pro-X carboxypeptidase n=1 Tax=Phyllotreta striolata TaxID=444603 RepID=A0A9P0DSN5_PHYSR|nr:unnamed protein product [Phyllotreta striolata]